jgi:phosphatidylethanolamine/phosphatidyl-N-methylethanolamine N-methyltransferase
VTLLAHLIKAPALTGAVVPSSQFLANAMADAAEGAAHIVELGAGTGPVTRALAQRYPDARLTVVELQPALARQLTRAYPRADVHARPAAEVLDELDAGGLPVVVVSSLPFRCLPAPARAETRSSILRFLRRHPGSWLVQFTYQPRAPFDGEHGFAWRRGRTVVANLPPAGVWTLSASA